MGRDFAKVRPLKGGKWTPPFSLWLHRQRNLVERFFSKLERLPHRREAMREACRKLPRSRKFRRCSDMDALYEAVTWSASF